MNTNNEDLFGAFNLLWQCLDVRPENNVLLVCEDPRFGWYDKEAATLLEQAIKEIGVDLSTIIVGGPDDALPDGYNELVDQHDTIIYLARIGDQDRFTDSLPGKTVAMLYARDAAALSSTYSSINHAAMKQLKAAIDQVSLSADIISITCPLGTQLECRIEDEHRQLDGEVTIKRFPLCVPQPILAKHMTGRVALANWLTPTGSNSYSPANCKINGVVFAEVEQGRIVEFQGERESVEAIKSHYELVANKFQINKDVVHSWHAGIHPACSFSGRIEDDPDRWSNSIFGSPRFVHFHTCGDYPPGEICWMVQDPTIKVDGNPLWQGGRLMVQNFTETAQVTDNWPELKKLFTGPKLPIGFQVNPDD